MATATYRYKKKVCLRSIERACGGGLGITLGDIDPPVYQDIDDVPTTSKDDLDEHMKSIGWEYESTDPVPLTDEAFSVNAPYIRGQFLFGATDIGSDTTEKYLWPGGPMGAAPTVKPHYRSAYAGTIRRMHVRQNTAAGNGEDIIYTLYVNNNATSMTVTIASDVVDSKRQSPHPTFPENALMEVRVTKALDIATSPTNILVALQVS